MMDHQREPWNPAELRAVKITLIDMLRERAVVFGKPVRIEWPNGAPFEGGNDEIANMIERLGS